MYTQWRPRSAWASFSLGGHPGWSEFWLGAQSFCRFCHAAAQISPKHSCIVTSSVVHKHFHPDSPIDLNWLVQRQNGSLPQSLSILFTVRFLSIWTDKSEQIVPTQIRLLPNWTRSLIRVHNCLSFLLHLLDGLLHDIITTEVEFVKFTKNSFFPSRFWHCGMQVHISITI